jgi:hypothetical protein
MTDLSIEQALFEGDVLRARSTKFADAWLPMAMALCKGFGSPPPDMACPEALFARPFGAASVAIVQVFWPRIRVLVLGRELYHLLHDPFAIAERFPPDCGARGSLPDLSWPPEPLPRRTVAMLDNILKNGDGPFLLGASQTLVDGGKICLQLPVPDPKRFRDLWAMLPDSVRRSIWPATFAFNNALGFDLLAMPALPKGGLHGYLDDEHARDYPDSRYERHLQMAIESNDQPMLDKLLARKTTSEMIRLALIIIAVAFGAAVLMRVLSIFRVI